MRGRRLWALGLAAAAGVYVGVEFLQAARATLRATRGNACRALDPAPLPAPLSGGVPPGFSLPDATGKLRSLDEFRGRPVLLNFWATWCPPCVEEMPALEALARELAGRATVLAVSVDTDWDKVRRFFKGGTALTVLLDAQAELPRRYGTEKYPETFLIDARGTVRHYVINKRKWDAPQAAACLLGLD